LPINENLRGLCKGNNTLTSGITIPTGAQAILSKFQHYSSDGIHYKLVFETNTLAKDIPADAALGFGEHLFTLPAAIVQPLEMLYQFNSLAPTGLSATAGEVGFGTTIASGAVAVLSGTAAFENISEGRTLANHVAATPLVTEAITVAPTLYAQSATVNPGPIDASAGTTKVHLNLASTWNQTSSEDLAFSVKGVFHYKVLALDFGVE
jgi:hypothetical protein